MKIKTEKYDCEDFSLELTRGPMSKSNVIEEVEKKNKLDMMPDGYFGDNGLFIKTPFYNLHITTENAVEQLNTETIKQSLKEKTFENPSFVFQDKLKVKMSNLWKDKKIDDMVDESKTDQDWTYLNYYRGNLKSNKPYKVEKQEVGIDKSRLSVENKIQFYNELYLHEDELDDFGYSRLRLRVRVQKDSCFILMRSYIRVDRVAIRSVENRIFIDFVDNYSITRELDVFESTWEAITKKGFKFDPSFNIDPNQADMIRSYLDVKYKECDKVIFDK